MKTGWLIIILVVFYFSIMFGTSYADEINQCVKAEKNGAEVIWIHHKLLGKACYIDVNINDTPVKLDAEDWLRYFVYEEK